MDQIEKVARAMALAFNKNPDELVPETGYKNANMIPRWYQEREFAVRHIAAVEALKQDVPIAVSEDIDREKQNQLADIFMGAHWSWEGNKPSNFMVTHRDTAMALARLALVFSQTSK